MMVRIVQWIELTCGLHVAAVYHFVSRAFDPCKCWRFVVALTRAATFAEIDYGLYYRFFLTKVNLTTASS